MLLAKGVLTKPSLLSLHKVVEAVYVPVCAGFEFIYKLMNHCLYSGGIGVRGFPGTIDA